MATKENIFAVARGYHDGLTLISVVYKMISHAEERLNKLKAKRTLPQAEWMIATVREWLEDPTDALAGVRAVAQDTVPSNYTDAQGHMVPASVWAHYLSCAFLAEALKGHYVVVMVDVNKGHNTSLCVMYGPLLCLPTMVILEDDGKKLTTENPGKWAEGHHYSPEKALAFLKEWASPN